mgnify:CR=1 FL=1
MNHFWQRWRNKYLTNLRERHTAKKQNNTNHAKIGDVVLIHDDAPRNQWRLGVFTKLHPGKDGLVTVVTLRVNIGNELSRPIEKLYPLEITDEPIEEQDTVNDASQDVQEEQRPQSAAAKAAAQKIKGLHEFES